MSTFINSGLVSLNARLAEIDILLREAKKNFEKNDALYNTLCRSTQVLLSAHFEGYIKELIRNALDDINTYSTFKDSHKDLKRKFCNYFVLTDPDKKDSKIHNEKVTKLIALLEKLDTKFEKEYMVSDENKNPKATVIDKAAEQFGIERFFIQLEKSSFSVVFGNTKQENGKLSTKTKNYLLKSTLVYPYKTKLDFLAIDLTLPVSDLWNTFLSNFLKRRHDIAHGTETGNAVSHGILEEDLIKVRLLLYAFTAFICLNANPAVV